MCGHQLWLAVLAVYLWLYEELLAGCIAHENQVQFSRILSWCQKLVLGPVLLVLFPKVQEF